MRRVSEDTYEADIESDEHVASLAKAAVEYGASVYEVSTVHDSLEDLYFMLLKKGVEN